MKLFGIIISLFSFSCFGQFKTGMLVNEFDNSPIFGVTILADGKPISFSNQEGVFEIDDVSKIKEITFSHLAYFEKKINTNDIKAVNQKILLTEKTTLLTEIELVAEKKLTLKEILKKSSDFYQKRIRKNPYFAPINLKQVTTLNTQEKSFLEIDGWLYNFIPKDNNPFIYPFILPENFRKTIESSTLKTEFIEKDNHPYNVAATNIMTIKLLDYQCVNIAHPLTKSSKYSFNLMKNDTLSEVECYHIQFFQKKGIHIKRNLFNVYGEMWINAKDFSIIKHKICFDFDNVFSNEMELDYQKIDEQLLIKKLIITTKIINPKYKLKNIYSQCLIDFDNSVIVNFEDLTKKYLFNINYYFDQLNYNTNYWNKKETKASTELIDDFLKTISPKDFEIGSKQKILDQDSKYYTKQDEEFRKQQIKLHKDILNKIQL